MNQVSDLTQQPVSNIQLSQLQVQWVEHSSVRPNKYNPNKMAWHERMLLRQSLLEDGWTQPIVTLPDRTIVDGEQRWTTAGMDLKPGDIQEVIDKMQKRKDQGAPISESILTRLIISKQRLEEAIHAGQRGTIASITGGLVPITVLDLGDEAHKMISTIRHNRARGIHQLDAMVEITNDLVQLGLDLDDLEKRLGMDDEEIKRFMQASEGQLKSMESQLSGMDFSPTWSPVHLSNLSPEAQVQFGASAEANKAFKENEIKFAEKKAVLASAVQAEIRRVEDETGNSLTQPEKEDVERRLKVTLGTSMDKMPEIKLRKMIMFFLPDEYDDVIKVLGDTMASSLVRICREILANNGDSSH